jgi:predicted DNA-binding protein
MRPPNKQRASYRLNPDVRERLAQLAKTRGQTQTAVLEALINDASNGADAYLAHFAALQSWLAYNLVKELFLRQLPDEGARIHQYYFSQGLDLLGGLPAPPEVLREQAGARLEAGQLDAGTVRVLRRHNLLDRERS